MNKELQNAEENMRCANEEYAAMTDELERKIRLSEQYVSELAFAQETAELRATGRQICTAPSPGRNGCTSFRTASAVSAAGTYP